MWEGRNLLSTVSVPLGYLLILARPLHLFYSSATADELLRRGFKVRAATRDLSKTVPLRKKFEGLYGEGVFEAVEMEDMASKEAWLQALAGELIHIVKSMDRIRLTQTAFPLRGRRRNPHRS